MSTQNWNQIIKHCDIYTERNGAVNQQNASLAQMESNLLCIFATYVFRGLVDISSSAMMIMIVTVMYHVFVCFKNLIRPGNLMSHFKMHENHHVNDLQESVLCLRRCGNIGHLDDIGVNVGLPLFLLCVGRALMSSCAVVAIAGSTVGGWAWHRGMGGSGKCHDITKIQKNP